ncbi:phosphate ABC transporter permease PtsA [Phreatobacter cathodiphilus]|uniref:Phosphate transport system permease protein PstA n=1 Tax=Phreatobacter cathodiphilus TaxID=1868589 RepID=A0A2S0NC77_9HYPH|nr:phosphate ABC transporter permease PtsA [Phreatobacter cathodiphilus]
MTDVSLPRVSTDIHTNDQAQARLKARYRSEFLFKSLGLGAVLVAAGFLVIFLSTIITQAIPAFTQNYLKVSVELKPETFNPRNATGAELTTAVGAANFDAVVNGAVRGYFPAATDRTSRRALGNLVSSGAPSILRRDIVANPGWLGTTRQFYLPLDDSADLYFKGQTTDTEVTKGLGELGVSGTSGQVQLSSTVTNFQPLLAAIKTQLTIVRSNLQRDLAGKERVAAGQERDIAALARAAETANGPARDNLLGRVETERRQLAATQNDITQLRQRIETLTQRISGADSVETLDNTVSSYLVRINGGVIKLAQVQSANATGEVLIPPSSTDVARPGAWEIVRIVQPESNRRITDREIAYLESLKERGLVERRISREFFFGGASREAELAGVWVAIVGSFLTLLITLGLSFPVGVAAAIYLEEFAPKNRWTEMIEVNINNLAAVPSIIYGLLGLAVFLNVFGMPRSAPVVGGFVLALMTLPIIIIASRAAIRAVPPSVKEAALGVGASHQQAVFHHVLPLAMPGILTGTILGMAHALGETAPLLMIGMVAFVVDSPRGFTDAATLLPVQIFMWADFPEQAFQNKTAAAIVVLLLFLIVMNAAAVFLRKKFERRW